MTDTHTATIACLQRWQCYLAATRQRRLWVWPTSNVSDHDLNAFWQVFAGPHLWIGDDVMPNLPVVVRPLGWKQARTQLGQEAGSLVIDARTHVDADALGAVTGALKGGGVVIMLVEEAPHGRFEQWCRQLWADDRSVITVDSQGLSALPLPPSMPSCHDTHTAVGPAVAIGSSPWDIIRQQTATADQQNALDCLQGAPARALTVLTAARGRGKSAALGMAIAAWLHDGDFEQLWLTAPRAAATHALFDHLQRHCPAGTREGNHFTLAGKTVHFLAPDVLTQQLENEGLCPALLLVDEAAALPLPFLQQWLACCPHVVLSTTLHGYEGSAHGFSHFLDRYTAQSAFSPSSFCHCVLATPVRWANDDPLEALVTRMLCLDARPWAQLDAGPMRIEAVSQSQLLEQSALLHQIFGLLVQAHYRTSPSDLQTLLDHPALSLWIARVDERATAPHVIAVVMAFDEGALSTELAEAVTNGRRRPRGHLLPQTLALHAGDPAIAQQRWRRITRIAVHPQRQRQGIGSLLLKHVYQCCQREGVDLLGASFGGKCSTLAFWQRNNFSAVRVGLKDDTVTGERAVMVAQACHDHALLPSLRSSFWSTFRIQLAFELATLSPTLVAMLLNEPSIPVPSLSAEERAAVYRFGCEKAPLASVRPLLQQALLRHAGTLSAIDRAVMAGVLFQGRSETWARAQLPQLAGKRAFEQWLREKVALWSRNSAC